MCMMSEIVEMGFALETLREIDEFDSVTGYFPDRIVSSTRVAKDVRRLSIRM